jgi:regulatory Fis family protein
VPDHTIGPAPDAGAVLADLVECLAAIGRSMQDELDPRRFLEEFSAKVPGTVPLEERMLTDALDQARYKSKAARLLGLTRPGSTRACSASA